MARLLKPFGITPHSVRIGDRTPKGYETVDFEDSWKRYLNPVPTEDQRCQAATAQHPNNDAGICDFRERNSPADVAAQKCEITNENGVCCVVAAPGRVSAQGQGGIEEEL